MAKNLRDKKINQIMYISLGGALVAIILFIVLFNFFTNKRENENNDFQVGDINSQDQTLSEEANSSIGKKVDELENSEDKDEWQAVQVTDDVDEQSNEDISNQNNTQTNDIATSPEISDNTSEIVSMNMANASEDETTTGDGDVNVANQETEEAKDPTFSMPVDGEIAKSYGKEKLIYSDTLKEWTTHLGIDIKADKTSVVKASADGSVKSIKNDPRYGLTVVVEHDNGFSSVYSNLLTAEFVVVGETVKAGQTLGTVGNSATFEILDEAHLHFEILKDGNSVDPEMYIK